MYLLLTSSNYLSIACSAKDVPWVLSVLGFKRCHCGLYKSTSSSCLYVPLLGTEPRGKEMTWPLFPTWTQCRLETSDTKIEMLYRMFFLIEKFMVSFKLILTYKFRKTQRCEVDFEPKRLCLSGGRSNH